MPSVAHVRDISQHAEGYPSQRGGKAVASLGLGLGLRLCGGRLGLARGVLVAGRLPAGEQPPGGKRAPNQGEGWSRACQDTGRSIPYIRSAARA